ncbi:hypothetical protein AQUCO_01100590v1 [Aquilegia coerulea]|uniref:Glycosyltransferase N-terminal domain-containing protein n=1 Tax=Aquilegia coerulea TaxID=218851 RepID=A0A2G5E7S9_AQUCA|nr:hypothetical protein AQUCO_01100590v1 [Aquilegia coerulea]
MAQFSVSNIHFHDFDIPQIVTPPPDIHISSSNFPSHMLPTFTAASTHLREPLGVLLRGLSTTIRRVVVVYDTMMSFAAREASFLSNAEAYCFNSCSVFAVLHFIWEAYGNPAMKGLRSPDYLEFLAESTQWVHLCQGDIFNACDSVEGRFLDIIAGRQLDKMLWALGPFNPVAFETGGAHHDHHKKCLEWLNKQPQSSVIFVSFGTLITMSDDQITQFAMGLEKSEQRFIWVLRDADQGDIYKPEEGRARKAQLPNGFEERIKGIGLAGLLVREWAQKDELLSSDAIESSIRKLMVSDEGNMMRKRAKELSANLCRAVSASGTSTFHLESFLNHISR